MAERMNDEMKEQWEPRRRTRNGSGPSAGEERNETIKKKERENVSARKKEIVCKGNDGGLWPNEMKSFTHKVCEKPVDCE